MSDYLVKDDNLLVLAKGIFGQEFVVEAYVSFFVPDYLNKNLLEEAKSEMYPCKPGMGDILIETDIVLKFVNDKVVKFNTSEWGSISTDKFEEYNGVFTIEELQQNANK